MFLLLGVYVVTIHPSSVSVHSGMSSTGVRYQGGYYVTGDEIGHLLCAVCQALVHKPLEFSCCGKLVCAACFPVGPVKCKECSGSDAHVSKFAEREALGVTVGCPRGCGWNGPLADVALDTGVHFMSACKSAGPACILGCGVPVPMANLREHLTGGTCSVAGSALRTRSGRTKPGEGWFPYAAVKGMCSSVVIDVDTRPAGFEPGDVHYLTTVHGVSEHFMFMGSSSVYQIPGVPWHQGFRMYLFLDHTKLTAEFAASKKLSVAWMGSQSKHGQWTPTYAVTHPHIFDDLATFGSPSVPGVASNVPGVLVGCCDVDAAAKHGGAAGAAGANAVVGVVKGVVAEVGAKGDAGGDAGGDAFRGTGADCVLASMESFRRH